MQANKTSTSTAKCSSKERQLLFSAVSSAGQVVWVGDPGVWEGGMEKAFRGRVLGPAFEQATEAWKVM